MIYYIANSIYQFAYALPVYQSIGGTFVVTSHKKMNHFIRFLKEAERLNSPMFLSKPTVVLIPRDQLHTLEGVLVFFSNSIDPKDDYSRSITCFHEHGTSDKKYEGGDSIALEKLNKYDYLLLSGPKNKERLIDIGIHREKDCLKEIGCLRFDDYINGKFSKEESAQVLNIKDRTRKNILYAPTWKFGNGTFKKYASSFIDSLTSEYNLILRPHYHDRRYGHFLFWLSKLKGKKHVYFSEPDDVLRHDTYAAFAVSDLLISDISSVIYEYLVTNKPIILVKHIYEHRHQMPKDMDVSQHVDHYIKGEDIVGLVKNNLANATQSQFKYKSLSEKCFYNTSGGAVKQLAGFLQDQVHKRRT